MEDKDRYCVQEQLDRNMFHRGNRPSRGSKREKHRSPVRTDRRKGMSHYQVYVTNIVYDYSWQDLKDLFRDHVGDVSFVKLFVDKKNKFKGTAIVVFPNYALVKKCLQVMNGLKIQGRRLIVRADFDNERDKHGNLVTDQQVKKDDRTWDLKDTQGRDRESRRDNYDSENNTIQNIPVPICSQSGDSSWSINPKFLDYLGIKGPIFNKIFVRNIDYNVDEKKLREVFKLAGRIVDLELYCNNNGIRHKYGVIEYYHPVEAVQAISMFNSRLLYDRMLVVRMYKPKSRDTILPEGLKSIGMGLGENGQPLTEVSHNLSSINKILLDKKNNTSNVESNSGIQNVGTTATMLSNLMNTPALPGLANVSVALQNLAEMQKQLLANSLNKLGLVNNSLMTNSVVQKPILSNLADNNMNQDSIGSIQSFTDCDNRQYSSSKETYDTAPPLHKQYVKTESDYRNIKQESEHQCSTASSHSQKQNIQQKNFVSDAILVNNLPTSVSWTLLNEKFGECGKIQYIVVKNNDSAIIRYSSEWEAEKAIRLLNRARLDGRTIEVAYF